LIGLSGAFWQIPTGQLTLPQLPPAGLDSAAYAALGQYLASLVGRSVSGASLASPPSVAPQNLVAQLLSTLQAGLGNTSAALSETYTFDPPLLPSPLVSRLASFADLSHLLDSHLAIAVVGYPKSGKTTAIAEFVHAHPNECLWLDAADSRNTQASWRDVVLYRLARFLNLADASAQTVQQALIDRSRSRRLLVVIDDAHLLSDLDELTPLIQTAAASQQRIQLILVGVDEPVFLERLRSAALPDWRLPGMTDIQAVQLFESQGRTLSESQRRAIAIIVIRTDGHPGMLRLVTDSIDKIQTEADLPGFLKDFVDDLGTGLEAFQAHLIKRFRAALNPDEQELCLRLAIAFRTFPKRLGKALWLVGRTESSFQSAWSDCVLRVLQPQSNGRYSLPELYRRGLLDAVSAADASRWHAAAADELAQPQAGRLDPFDASDSVRHRVLSGDLSQALDDAARFLASATGRAARPVREFLTRLFEAWLAGAPDQPGVSQTAVIRWLAMTLPIYRESGQSDRADQASMRLQQILQSADSTIERPAILLGWGILLTHASICGNVALAETAADEVGRKQVGDVIDDQFDMPTIAVISAYLTAHENPITYLARIISSRSTNAPRLWHPKLGFDFWRAVSATIYLAAERDQSAEKTCRMLAKVADLAQRCAEPEVSLILMAAVSRMQIDLLRDFPAAVATAHTLPSPESLVDARLCGHRQHTFGNALRCAGDFVNAATAYRAAITVWPSALESERAESLVMLGICHGRQQEYSAAVATFLEAGAIYAEQGTSFYDLTCVQCLLEAGMSAALANQLGKSLRCLIRAHAMLRTGDPTRPEWVTLAQLAWHIADRTTGKKTGPDAVLPGFTLGLRGPIPDAQDMDPLAPTLMLGHACASHGLLNRGLQLLLEVWYTAATPERRIGSATFGFDAAIALERLDLATEFGIAVIDWRWAHSDIGAPDGFREYLLNEHVGRIVNIAIDNVGSAGWNDQLQSALDLAERHGDDRSPAKVLLVAAFRGILAAGEDDQDESLQTAFSLALRHRATNVARHICFYWIFRYAMGRPIHEAEFVVWEWRMAWLTYEVGSKDTLFLKRFLDQQRQLWDRASSQNGFPWIQSLLQVLNNPSPEVRITAERFRDRLAEQAIGICGVGRAMAEVALQLQWAPDLDSTEHLRRATLSAMGNLLLSPVAPDFYQKLKPHTDSFRSALNNRQEIANGPKPQWFTTVAALETLITVLESGDSIVGVQGALLHLAPVASTFDAPSEANFYIWLRESIQQPDGSRDSFETITRLVTGERAAQLLESTEVPVYLRTRLAVAHFSSKGFNATSQLCEALIRRRIQESTQGPVAVSAISETKVAIDSALHILTTCIAKLDEAEATCRGADASPNDLWSICINRGNLRKLVAAYLLKIRGSESEARLWLNGAAADYRAAIGAVRELNTKHRASLMMRAAIEGRTVAKALNNDSLAAEFVAELDVLAADPANRAERERLEAAQCHDPLEPGVANQSPDGALRRGGEEAIQSYTNYVMEAFGYPVDRRRYVEDDVRKQARTELAQWEFCRYLQPLQNLIHLRSPETVYARPTVYTCSCELLGHRTAIETEDIDLAIDAMRRTYCDGCLKQSPLRREASSDPLI